MTPSRATAPIPPGPKRPASARHGPPPARPRAPGPAPARPGQPRAPAARAATVSVCFRQGHLVHHGPLLHAEQKKGGQSPDVRLALRASGGAPAAAGTRGYSGLAGAGAPSRGPGYLWGGTLGRALLSDGGCDWGRHGGMHFEPEWQQMWHKMRDEKHK